MKDLTQGSIVNHIFSMATPLAVCMFTQMVNQLVGLYFITRIGVSETAGVNAAWNVFLIVASSTQVVGAGVVALVAQAIGRRDMVDANLVFNQSMVLSAVCGVAIMTFLYISTRLYLWSVAADEQSIEAGLNFINWVLPGYALTFPTTVLSSALQGAGIVKPTVVLYSLTLLVNAILSPILIAGWGTGYTFGVMGAGLATTIAAAIGFVFFFTYFHRLHLCMAFSRADMIPRFKQWRRVLIVGLPAGGDIALLFLFNAVVYYAIRDLGPAAQSGFGIGSRVLQTLLLPALCICLCAGPIAGQNFGASNAERVRDTFRKTAILGSTAMVATTILVLCQSSTLIGIFDADSSTSGVASNFLKFSSLALVAQGLVTTCSGMFLALGNTVPALISSCVRLLSFAMPAIWLSTQAPFEIENVWYLSVATLTLQAVVSLWLLRLEFQRRLPPLAAAPARRREVRQSA